MKVLFVSRKKRSDVGGLSRFTIELTSQFPKPSYLLSPDSLGIIAKLPFLHIDIIHLCDATLLPLGVILKFLLRTKLTLTAHGLDLTFTNPIYQGMLRMMFPKVDALILVSHAVKNLLVPFSVSKEKVYVIPNGISISHLQVASGAARPGLARLNSIEGKIVLLTVGNLVERKGHMWFIKEVFSELPSEFMYLIVGDGPERRKLEWFITRFNLKNRVFLLGRLTVGELSFTYKKADIYVCPNQQVEGDIEGFGIAAGEAAAMGLPVVASRVDGIPEAIKDGENGILVEPKAEAFIRALLQLTDHKLGQEIGTRAKVYTRRNFSWERTRKRYESTFHKLLTYGF